MIIDKVIAFFSGTRKRHAVMRPDEAITELDPNGMILGYEERGNNPLVLPWNNWIRHCLVVGIAGVGKEKLREWLFFQQIAKGGGLIWADWHSYDENLHAIQDMARTVNREADVLVLDLEAGDKTDLFEAIRANKIVYAKLPVLAKRKVPETLTRVLLDEFGGAVTELLKLRREDRPKIPFLNYLQEYGTYAAPVDGVIFQQARGANIALVPVIQSLASLDNLGHDMKDNTLGNTWNKVFFAAASSKSGWPGSGYMDHSVTEEAFAEARKRLDMGEAIAVSPGSKILQIRIPYLRFYEGEAGKIQANG